MAFTQFYVLSSNTEDIIYIMMKKNIPLYEITVLSLKAKSRIAKEH